MPRSLQVLPQQHSRSPSQPVVRRRHQGGFAAKVIYLSDVVPIPDSHSGHTRPSSHPLASARLTPSACARIYLPGGRVWDRTFPPTVRLGDSPARCCECSLAALAIIGYTTQEPPQDEDSAPAPSIQVRPKSIQPIQAIVTPRRVTPGTSGIILPCTAYCVIRLFMTI